MVDALGGTLARDLVVLAQERRQLQRLEVVGQKNLRGVAHDAASRQQLQVGARRGRRDGRSRQIGIDRHVEAWRPPLDPAQHQMLHGVEADGASRNGVTHGRRDLLDLERLHQAQDLHELALALLAHARLEQAAQRGELLGQLPAGQRRGLVERVDLLLDQRQVMQRVEHEVLALVGARMASDHLRAASDHHLVHVTAHKHLAVTEARRHRVVVAPVAHQRQRGDARAKLLAGVVWRRQRLAQSGQIALQPLADGLVVATQAIAHALSAAVQKMGVQRREAVEHRDRHQEVAPRITDQPFDLALVVALARSAEPVLEQVMRLQLAEHPRALPLAVTQDAGHRDLGVVVEDRLRHAAEEAERSHVAVAERFRRLRRIGHHKAGIRVRQVKREEVDLALHPADDADRLAEVGLGMARQDAPAARTSPRCRSRRSCT